MVGFSGKLNSGVPERNYAQFPSSPRFASAPAVAKQAAAETVNLASHNVEFAEKLFKLFGKFSKDVRVANMSLEDWAMRFLTIFGVYIPQGFFAVKEDKHVWETNGRNALVWTMTLAMTALTKSDKFGVNTLLNKFMSPDNIHEKTCFDIEVAEAQKKQIEDKVKTLLEDKVKSTPTHEIEDKIKGKVGDVLDGKMPELTDELGSIGKWKLKGLKTKHAAAENALKALGEKFDTLLPLAEKAGVDITKASDVEAALGKRLTALYDAVDEANEPVIKENAQAIKAKKPEISIAGLDGNDKAKWSKLRMKGNYFELLRKTGQKVSGQNGAVWAGLDINQCDQVMKYLNEQAKKQGLNETEQKLLDLSKQMVRRSGAFRLLSTAIITAATVYFIGGVAMEIVNKFIAPFDHDFVPPDEREKKKKDPALQSAGLPLPEALNGAASASSGPPLRHSQLFDNAFQPKQPAGVTR